MGVAVISSRPATTMRRNTSPRTCTPRGNRRASRSATVDLPAAGMPVTSTSGRAAARGGGGSGSGVTAVSYQAVGARVAYRARVSVARTIALFVLAALAEIGGAWLVWQGVREHRGVAWIGAGVAALAAYGFVATLQDEAHFGRILAAYGGIFVAGSLAWGIVADGFRPDRWDLAGAALCLAGVSVIMFAPRPG